MRVETIAFPNVTVSANGYNATKTTLPTIAGYISVGVVGYYTNNSALVPTCVAKDTFGLRNVSSASVTSNAVSYILYVKE